MDLTRSFALILIIMLLSFQSLAKNPGLVFIHGTKDHRLDADGVYWKKEFTEVLAKAMPNPGNLLIVHCDFSQYMWAEEASGCLASQMLEFIKQKKIDKLIIYTHSNGSNVLRFIASNPGFDPRFAEILPFIKEVIALTPSDGGTPIADETFQDDVIVAGLTWLLGYEIDAVRQQRLGEMHFYNQNILFGSKNRPSLPFHYRVIVGSDVYASPLSSHSYCNGYRLNAALKLTKLYLDKCSDGFLNCTSQLETGNLWFKDVTRTEDQLPLNHNESRHSCFGLERILFRDLIDLGSKA